MFLATTFQSPVSKPSSSPLGLLVLLTLVPQVQSLLSWVSLVILTPSFLNSFQFKVIPLVVRSLVSQRWSPEP